MADYELNDYNSAKYDDLINAYGGNNNLDEQTPTYTKTTKDKTNADGWKIVLWIIVILTLLMVIAALGVSIAAYEKPTFTTAEQATLVSLAQKIKFDGNILLAAGFSDDLASSSSSRAKSNAVTPFLAGGGLVECQTLQATGAVVANSVSSATGLNVLTGNITATGTGSTISGTIVRGGSMTVSAGATVPSSQSISMTPTLLTMENGTNLTMNMQASGLSFTGLNATSSTLDANGLTLTDKKLIGTRYSATGMTAAVTTNNAKMAPIATPISYGSLSIPLASLELGSTFNIKGNGNFVSSNATHIRLVLYNGATIVSGQDILGLTGVDIAVPQPFTKSFGFDYTISIIAISGSTATTLASGSVTCGEDVNISSTFINLNQTNAAIDVSTGLNLSLFFVLVSGTATTWTLQQLQMIQTL